MADWEKARLFVPRDAPPVLMLELGKGFSPVFFIPALPGCNLVGQVLIGDLMKGEKTPFPQLGGCSRTCYYR